MIKSPEEYPWPSYQANALGKDDKLLDPHEVYQTLGKNELERYNNYRALFKHHIDESEFNEIRNAANKSWVLGNDKFRAEIKTTMVRGGGWPSVYFLASNTVERALIKG